MKTLFIVGSGRSGTSLMAQMLNAHSSICVPPELQILFEYSKNGSRLCDLFRKGKACHYQAEDFIQLIARRCPHKLELYFDYASFFRSQTYPIPDLRGLVSSFYEAIARAHGKPIFCEQTPWYGQRLDLVSKLFPDAKYIHMVRDGRDVAMSFARTPWWHDDPGANLCRWTKEVRTIMNYQKTLLGEKLLTIDYSDLVRQPENTLQAVCEHIGVAFEPHMLDSSTHIDYDQYTRFDAATISSAALNDWKARKTCTTFSTSCGQWQNHPPFANNDIPRRSARLLHELGYPVTIKSWPSQILKWLNRNKPLSQHREH